MRKGKGELTNGQLNREYERIRKLYSKTRNDYNSLRVAHNKLLKQLEALKNGKRIMLDLIIEAKKTDPKTDPFSEWLAEYLVDHLPTLTPPNEWVSVEERLPESQADVLVVAFWHERWQTMIGWHSDTRKKWRVITPHGEREPGGVTHWMALPAPPDRRPPEGEED